MKYLELTTVFELYALEAASGRMSKKRKKRWQRDLEDAAILSCVRTPGPRQPSHRFRHANVPDVTIERETRFSRNAITLLHLGLQLPFSYEATNGTVYTALDGIMIVLWRLASPSKWFTITRDLDWGESELKVIFADMISHCIPLRFAF